MNDIDANIAKLESGEGFTPDETSVFSLIKQTCNDFSPPVIARVAGGWVRDKIIGKPSDDIDIAIENATAIDFGKKLQQNCGSNSKLTQIEANPEQSKHLETVRVNMFADFWLDICCLRSDDFAEGHTKPGTPTSDAQRRDFSINALFYNINDSKVEDFVEGINDLKNQIIRTPIDPHATFKDDPLRMVRGFRMAARYSFKIESNVILSMKEFKSDFEKYITRDRVTQEIEKIFKGGNLEYALDLMFESQLFTSIFGWGIEPESALLRAKSVIKEMGDSRKLHIILAAIYQPLLGQPCVNDPDRKKKKIEPIIAAISRDLRFSLNYAESANNLLNGVKNLQIIRNNLSRVNVGKWVRSVGQDWKDVAFLIFDSDLKQYFKSDFQSYVESQHLSEAYNLKTLVNGKELADIHGVKPGPQVGKLVEELIEWQLDNQNGTIDDYKASKGL